MIPDEAVEAALSALFPDRASVSDFTRAVQEPTIRTILEAAAPHLMAPTMRAIAAEIGGDPATAVTDPAVHRLLKMLLDRANEMEATL